MSFVLFEWAHEVLPYTGGALFPWQVPQLAMLLCCLQPLAKYFVMICESVYAS
jgi:hypothetical protein